MMTFFNRLPQHAADMVAQIDAIGGPNLYNNYPRGWAKVGNCPLRFYKQNTYEGGIRDPLIVRWPAGIGDPGAIRTQYHHAIDVMPTILDVIGLVPPEVYKGIPQVPVGGQRRVAITSCPLMIVRPNCLRCVGQGLNWTAGSLCFCRARHTLTDLPCQTSAIEVGKSKQR